MERPRVRREPARRVEAPAREGWIRHLWQALSEGPKSTAEIARQLGREPAQLAQELDGFLRDGWITRTEDDRFSLDRVTGELRMNQRGFGFVSGATRADDVFIPPRQLHGAVHGDEVAVWVNPRSGGQGPEGQIMEILRRGTDRIVGRLISREGRMEVAPSDPRLPTVLVGRRRERLPARLNDYVVAEILSWPEGAGQIRGRIAEVLGPEGAPGLDVRVVMEEMDLPARFPEPVLKEARQLPLHVRGQDQKGRLDLTGDLVVTIDGADAKDLDDAISLKMGDDGYELGVHIADVGHYVPVGSRLDQEALKRGTSVYLVDRVIPMFPPELSNQIASLNPHERRLTLSCFVVVATDGRILRTHFHESVIESRHRLTYGAVNQVLAGQAAEGLDGIRDWLLEAHSLAERLHRRRMERGAVDFDLPEAKIRLDDKGRVSAIDLRERGPAERLIEEFMLLANEAVAGYLTEKELPVLYRVHESPADDKLEAFREMLGALGHRLPTPVTPKSLQTLLGAVKGRPEERVVTEALLRSMRQARYAAANLGHFGLASACYTHFTSPIRRYPDLFVHRVLKAHLRHQDTADVIQAWAEAAPAVAEQASTRERSAMDAERQSVLVKQIEYMADKVGETYGGVVSGVTGFGLFVELDNMVEGLIRIEDLPSDHYDFDPVHYTLSGQRRGTRYRLGDRVSVDVMRVDREARRIDFRLSDEEPGAPSVRREPKASPSRRRPSRAPVGRKKGKGRRRPA